MQVFFDALFLKAGYNAALVGVGAALLGFAAGLAGVFLFLRKRALVSDAAAHATLPGIGIAFIVMVALGGDGRALAGLLLGAAASAWVGLWAIDWMTRRTRLGEDAAIGAILSVFFGLGIVSLTVIQNLNQGRQAGLEDFLLGSAAGMLWHDARLVAVVAGLTAVLVWGLRRPMILVAFDPDHAAAMGTNTRRMDLAMMALVMAVTVIGLKLVGLVLIIALLIIPAVTARFWTHRAEHALWIAGFLGAGVGYVGAALSATVPALPTGPVIVLVAASVFTVSFLFSPKRGVAAAIIRRVRFQVRVHRRQGLLALARDEPIYDLQTLRVLRRDGLIGPDNTPTNAGAALAVQTAQDERRWKIARTLHHDTGPNRRYDGLTPIEEVFTPDEIATLDAHLSPPHLVKG